MTKLFAGIDIIILSNEHINSSICISLLKTPKFEKSVLAPNFLISMNSMKYFIKVIIKKSIWSYFSIFFDLQILNLNVQIPTIRYNGRDAGKSVYT